MKLGFLKKYKQYLREYIDNGFFLSICLVWMWSFPLEGYLAVESHIKHPSLYFIIFQAISLFTIYMFSLEKIVNVLFKFLLSTISLLTILIPFIEISILKIVIMSILGITFAPILAYALLSLKNSSHIFIVVSGVFLFAFSVQVILQILPLPLSIKFIILSLLFSSLALINVSKITLFSTNTIKIKNKCILITTFYITGGLLYEYIIPHIKENAFLTFPEHLYYLFGIIIGIFLYRKRSDFPVLFAIICGILSFSFFHEQNTVFHIISLVGLNTSFGLIEIFIILTIVKRDLNLRQVALLLFCMCSGILIGQILTFSSINEYIIYFVIVFGNLIMIATLFIFYFTKKEYEQFKIEPKISVGKDLNAIGENTDIYKNEIVKKAKIRLSEKEFEILNLVLSNKIIKEISEILLISESTVKTHMSRIYKKLNVKAKSDLIDLFLKK